MAIRKRILAGAVGALSAVLALSTTTPAGAYPPGQTILLGVSSLQVAKGATITLGVTRAKPGVVTIKFGTTVKRTVASSSYKTPSVLVKPSAAGIYVVTAKDATGDTATAKVYVPTRTVATSARVGAVTNAVFRYGKPGSLATVTVGSESYVGVINAAGTAVVPYALDNTGVQTITFTVGALALPSASIQGK